MLIPVLAVLVPTLPLAGWALNGLWGGRFTRRTVAIVACGAVAAAFAAAALLLWQIRLAPPPGRASAGGPSWIVDLYAWIGAGSIQVPLRLLVDPLSVAMALVVGGVGLLIHVYSVGYMDGDPGFARYFAYLNLFMASMFWLVLAGNLAAMFIGWEGVGLCSYLLIAFWFTRPAAAAAGVKAFLVTRLGDVGFLLGIFVAFGVFGTTDFGVMTRDAGARLALGGGAATALALLFSARRPPWISSRPWGRSPRSSPPPPPSSNPTSSGCSPTRRSASSGTCSSRSGWGRSPPGSSI